MDARIQAYDVKMTKSYENLLKEFGSIRAGRANPHVLDQITMAHPLPSSRWATCQFRSRECCRFSPGRQAW